MFNELSANVTIKETNVKVAEKTKMEQIRSEEALRIKIGNYRTSNQSELCEKFEGMLSE